MTHGIDPHLTWLAPERLRPLPESAKAHPDEQIERIARSIAVCGFDQPIVAAPNGEIIKGNARFAAALRLGLAEIPVIVRCGLSPERVLLTALADNRAAESHWRPEAIASALQRLLALAPELLPHTGFGTAFIQGLLQDAPVPKTAPPTYAPERSTLLRHCPHCGGVIAG